MFRSDLLKDRVVVVTGGGSGLGRSMALRAAGLGARVGLVGRTAGKLDEVAAEIRAAGGTAATATADVRDADAVHAAFDALEGTLGPLDSLINNAAGNFLAASETLSERAFDAVVKIVLYGTFHCTMDFARRIIDVSGRTGGNIVNITTTYAWLGSPFVLPSACAKSGVMVMTRSLAVEWATYGIRVNAIAPGPVPTEGAFSRLMAGGMEEKALERIPAKRFGTPDEIADAAMFLLAAETGWVTGETIVVDGGEWLQSGQEFAEFVRWDRGQVKQLLASLKPRR